MSVLLAVCLGIGVLALIGFLFSWPLARSAVRNRLSGWYRRAWLTSCALIVLAPVVGVALLIAIVNHFAGKTWVEGFNQQLAEGIVIGIVSGALLTFKGFARGMYREHLVRTLDRALQGAGAKPRREFTAVRRFLREGDRPNVKSSLKRIADSFAGADERVTAPRETVTAQKVARTPRKKARRTQGKKVKDKRLPDRG